MYKLTPDIKNLLMMIIKQKLIHERKMVKFSLLIFIFCLSISCNNKNRYEEMVLAISHSSNEVFDEEINGIKNFLKTKLNEQPIKYKEVERRVLNFENEIKLFETLNSVSEKRSFLINLRNNFKLKVNYASDNIKLTDNKIMNTLLRNDLKKLKLYFFRKIYNYQKGGF